MKLCLVLLAVVGFGLWPAVGRAERSVLQPGDVIALVGGEDMVACAELGHLELLLQRARPADRLRVRCLAWEGDTVFEQPRMLNYPPLEKQLDEIGATVVLTQFGQMESLAGEAGLPAFLAAYEKLLARLSDGGKRRVVLVSPGLPPERAAARDYERGPAAWSDRCISLAGVLSGDAAVALRQPNRPHLSAAGHARSAAVVAAYLLGAEAAQPGSTVPSAEAPLRQLIAAKNRLWTRSYRPENWAFLAGDRTSQPSSRDHRDPSKRWFPEEMQAYGPLIAAREAEIWQLAATLTGEK
jgi:hypothetical protein